MGDLPSTIGAYRVVRRLGEGGMGAVYEAVHEAIERRVAIKVLHPEFARNAEFTGRFFNEARAVNRVEHPGLVQISDFGQQADGTAYIVMELLKGESLSHRLASRGGTLPTAEVVQLSWQIADALAAAHAKDIVHRDLKPENIMLVSEPHMPGGERTKLLDFGIAKVADQGQGDGPRVQTKTDQFFGTPVYMSPEQCEGAGRVDAKSDVYSLGVMMFEMLSGQPPFMADGPGKILGMHMFMDPPLLKEKAPTVPDSLTELVQRLLVKKRELRPSMREVVAELAALSEKHTLPRPADSAHHDVVMGSVDPLRSTDVALLKSTLGASASQAASQAASQVAPRRRWRRIALLFAVSALLVLSAATALLVRFSPKHALVFARLRQAANLVAHATDPEPATPAQKPPDPTAPGQANPGAPAPTPAPATGAGSGTPAPAAQPPAGTAPALPPILPAGTDPALAGTQPSPTAAPGQPTAAPKPAAPKPAAKKPVAKTPVYKRPYRKIYHTIWRKTYRRRK